MAARVHSSFPPPPPSPPLPPSTSEQRKVFTLWMKSLVLNGRGCTVYDSNGGIVYRVDNYGSRCSDNVFLMDLGGKIVLNILKKKLAFGRWEGYKWSSGKRQQEAGAGAWFTVTRPCSSVLFQRSRPSSCEFRSDAGCAMRYKMDDGGACCAGKQLQASCRIIDDATGTVVAEVRRSIDRASHDTPRARNITKNAFAIAMRRHRSQWIPQKLKLISLRGFGSPGEEEVDGGWSVAGRRRAHADGGAQRRPHAHYGDGARLRPHEPHHVRALKQTKRRAREASGMPLFCSGVHMYFSTKFWGIITHFLNRRI
ncbi:hypothetical protein ABZP36_001921 [Zizania latifolia]